jgi:DNA-binding beta-propeller fold protein YncE
MHTVIEKKSRISTFFIILLVLFAVFTLGMGSRKDAMKSSQTKIFWPLPPDEPKIEFVRSITKPDDSGRKKGFFKKLWEFVAGESEKQIAKPFGIAVDNQGNLYVTDTALASVHVFNLKEGGYRVLKDPKNGRFISPVGVDVDKEGKVFVSDSLLRQVLVYSPKGKHLMDIKPPRGEELFQRPTGIAVNSGEDLLYIVDTLACAIHVYSTSGDYKFSFGKKGKDNGQFNFPTSIDVSKNGDIYVSDTMNFRIQIFDKNGRYISSFGKHGDGTGDLGNPRGVALDSDMNIYVVDTLFEAVQIFDKDGGLLLAFGKPGVNQGQFILPADIAIDRSDYIYIADSYNSRVQVFKYLKSSDQEESPEIQYRKRQGKRRWNEKL